MIIIGESIKCFHRQQFNLQHMPTDDDNVMIYLFILFLFEIIQLNYYYFNVKIHVCFILVFLFRMFDETEHSDNAFDGVYFG